MTVSEEVTSAGSGRQPIIGNRKREMYGETVPVPEQEVV